MVLKFYNRNGSNRLRSEPKIYLILYGYIFSMFVYPEPPQIPSIYVANHS